MTTKEHVTQSKGDGAQSQRGTWRAPPNTAEAVEAAQRRHEELMRLYRQRAPTPRSSESTAHDLAVLERHFQFIRDDDADAERGETDWEIRMSVRYYRRLFREYALADLTRYRENRIGLRWRTEMEVVAGKGQFSCGNKHCDATRGLQSYELLFAYVEQGARKRCLVKLRVCEECAAKLFYKKLAEMDDRDRERRRHRRRQRDESVPSPRNGIVPVERESRKRRRRDDADKGETRSDDERKNERTRDIHRVCREFNRAEVRDHQQSNPNIRLFNVSEAHEDDDDDKELRNLLL